MQTGGEGAAEFLESTGMLGPVGYEHFKDSKCKFVPSIVSVSQIDEVTEYFAKKDIRVDGFVQWQPASVGGSGAQEQDSVPVVPEVPFADKSPDEVAAEVACMAHGICGK